MMQKSHTPDQTPKTAAPSRPNEQGTVSVQGFVRIFDPNTSKIILETRA